MAVSRSLRIYYSDRLDQARYAVDVDVEVGADGESGPPICIGRSADGEVVLPSPQVPDLAVTLHFEAGQWRLTPRGGVCRLDSRTLALGECVPIGRGQELQIAQFTVEIDDLGEDTPAPTTPEALEEKVSTLIDRVHHALLPRIPTGPAPGGRSDRERLLIELEHAIEEIATPGLEADPVVAARLAGRTVLDELLRRGMATQKKGGQGRDKTPTDDPRLFWSEMVAVVPELERSLRRVVDAFERHFDKARAKDAADAAARVEKDFWPAWETWSQARLDDGFRRYLACRAVKKEVKDLVFGLGPLEDLLRMSSVSEIMVNDAHHIYIEHDHKLKPSGRRFVSDSVTQAIIERIVGRVGRRIDKSNPMVDARLPDGSRVNAVLPPLAVNGPCLTIRKFPDMALDLAKLEAQGDVSRSARKFLEASVKTRRNIIVSGGTGSGKTTMLNCLSGCIPAGERVITIEDVAELRPRNDHLVRLETRDKNLEGQGAYTIRDLVRNALRMRPDRVIVGECRGAEALDMLQAMNTGHDGSLTTIHANSPADVVNRLEVMVLMAVDLPIPAIHRQIASGVDLVVHLERRGSRRLVTRISEIAGFDRRTGTIRQRDLYDLEPRTLRLLPTGRLPSFLDELIDKAGLEIEVFYDEVQPGREEPS